MILIISTSSEPCHNLEFVVPIESILSKNKIKFQTKHYSEKFDSNNFSKIIICGTSLKDNQFLEDIENFEWIKNCEKPILGICAGMQIVSLVFGSKLKRKKEIGFYLENFKKDFLSLKGKQEVYHLHNNYVGLPNEFEKFTGSEIPQAIKHKSKEIYGTLFHPEVRNKEVIENFIKH